MAQETRMVAHVGTRVMTYGTEDTYDSTYGATYDDI